MNPNCTQLGRRLAALRSEYGTTAFAIASATGTHQTMLTATETGDRVADTRTVGAIMAVADVSIMDTERLAALWADAGRQGQPCAFTLCPVDGCEMPAALTALASSKLSPEAWHQIAGIVRDDLSCRVQTPSIGQGDLVEMGGFAHA